MAYCRMNSDSDVYVFLSASGWTCCGCRLADEHAAWFTCETPQEMVNHLLGHMAFGHKVPQRAIDRLKGEVMEYA